MTIYARIRGFVWALAPEMAIKVKRLPLRLPLAAKVWLDGLATLLGGPTCHRSCAGGGWCMLLP